MQSLVANGSRHGCSSWLNVVLTIQQSLRDKNPLVMLGVTHYEAFEWFLLSVLAI
jgi:hypothetical protein